MMETISNVFPTGINLYLVFAFLLVALGLSAYWVRGSSAENKFPLFVLTFWLASGTYYEVIIKSAPGLNVLESRPFWIFLILFSGFLGWKLTRTGLRRWQNPDWRGSFAGWEVALFCLLTFQVLTYLYYLNDLGLVKFFKQVGDDLLVLVLIMTMVELVSKESLLIIRKAVLFAAAASSVIALIQLVGGDAFFMRYADARPAFGGYYRSVGIFTREYYHSYFVLGALIWTLVSVRDPKRQNILIIIYVIGVITTFHRMSYLVMATIFAVYYLTIRRPSGIKVATTGLGMAVLFLSVFLLFGDRILSSEAYQGRFSDSVDGRKGYWTIVMEAFPDKPIFGHGGTDNEVYYVNMLRHTRNRDRATGDAGDIHNGFLQILFVYGLPATVAFAFYILLSIFYFGRLSTIHTFFAIPFLFALLYLMANMTNNFSLTKYLAHLAAIYFGIGLGARYLSGPSELPQTNYLNRRN